MTDTHNPPLPPLPAIPTPSGLTAAELTATSLTLPPDLTWEQWANVGIPVMQTNAAAQWWLGDWILHAETHLARHDTDGTPDSLDMARIRRTITSLTQIDLSTLRHARTTAAAFPPERRRPDVSWSHHETLTACDPNLADELLAWAATTDRTVADLRAERRRRETPDTTATENPPPPAKATIRLTAPTPTAVTQLAEWAAVALAARAAAQHLDDVTIEIK